MSTIVTIQSTDIIANSRADINTNFSALNTDKVEGQSVSVDSEVALFSGTGGKTIKRASSTGIAKLTSGVLSVVTAPSGAIVGDTDSQTLTNKTLTTPTIASFVNATHSHLNAAGGGTLSLPESALNLTDLTTGDVSITKHGFAPKAPNDTTKFLRGDATWAVPPNSAYYPQKVGFVGTARANPKITVTSPVTGADSSNPFYVVLSSGSALPTITKYVIDATSNAVYGVTAQADLTLNTAMTIPGICILGSYIYYGGAQNGGSTYQCRRLDLGTLANDTNLTISGTAPTAGNSAYPMFTDGTFLYINDGTTVTSMKKYSVSGTTITFVSSITFTSMIAGYQTWCDGTNVYQFYGNGLIGKWALAGGARTTISTFDFTGLTNNTASTGAQSIFGIVGSTKMMVAMAGSENIANGTTLQNNYIELTPIAYQ